MQVAQAEDRTALPPQAVAAFAEGKRLLAAGKDARQAFAEAAAALGNVPNGVFPSPQRSLNYGNACFLAGDLPGALASFRGGGMADPHQRALRENLAYARLQVHYPSDGRGRPEPDFWPVWLPRLYTGPCLTLAIGGYVLAWLALSAGWRRRNAWFALLATGLLAIAGIASYGWLLLDWEAQRNCDFPVVVIADDNVPFRTGNGDSYPLHGDLPRLRLGMEARQLAARGDWLQLAFASGEIGWVKITAVRGWALLHGRA